jgi:hypothetical protein
MSNMNTKADEYILKSGTILNYKRTNTFILLLEDLKLHNSSYGPGMFLPYNTLNFSSIHIWQTSTFWFLEDFEIIS